VSHHQESSIWGNYSWEPEPVENENEPPLPAGGLNLPLVFEDELGALDEDYYWGEYEDDSDFEEVIEDFRNSG